MTIIIFAGAMLVQAVMIVRYIQVSAVQTYKIGYYEQKLKSRNVDISHVENITIKEILNK